MYFSGEDKVDGKGAFEGKFAGNWDDGSLRAMARALYIHDPEGDGIGPFETGYLSGLRDIP